MTLNENPAPGGYTAPATGVGCLAGIGLGVAFVAISALAYVLLGLFSVPQNIRLLIAFACGPILGTAAAIPIALMFSRRAQRAVAERHEAASRDSS